MKLRNTLILFGVVVILLVFVYVFEIRNPKEPTGKSRKLGEILSLGDGDISKVELAYADSEYEKIICSRDGDGQWQIEQPMNVKADQKVMGRLLAGTLGKNIHDTLKDPGGLAEYGLDNPRITATFHLKDGASATLFVGDTVPTGSYVYVKQKSIPDISLVPASIADELKKTLDEIKSDQDS